MFNPVIGPIIMALAVLACLGSLLGWQFTIAQTAKSASDERMFPHFFSRVNAMGAPVTGMIILGVVQTLLALMTISPTLSEQFSALVNLSVVTNVVPYIIALSALMVMMRTAGVPEGKYRFNTAIATIGMALQRLRHLRVGQGCCPRRHARHRRRLHRLGLHRLALHDGRRSGAGGMRREDHGEVIDHARRIL